MNGNINLPATMNDHQQQSVKKKHRVFNTQQLVLNLLPQSTTNVAKTPSGTPSREPQPKVS